LPSGDVLSNADDGHADGDDGAPGGLPAARNVTEASVPESDPGDRLHPAYRRSTEHISPSIAE